MYLTMYQRKIKEKQWDRTNIKGCELYIKM